MGGLESLWELVGLVGVLTFFAGLHMIWQAREDVLFWLEEYFRLLRLSVRGMKDPQHAPLELMKRQPEKKHTLQMAIGLLLVLIVAPMLFWTGLALVWLSRRGG